MLGLYDNNNKKKKKKRKYNNKKKKKKEKKKKKKEKKKKKGNKTPNSGPYKTFGEGCELQVFCKGGAKHQKTLICGKIRGVNLGSCENLHHRKK